MKKNLFLMALAAGSLALATSCSSDEPQPVVNEGTVTFSVKLPEELQSRTFGDGLSASQLTYVVYETGKKDPLEVAKDLDNNLVAIGEASFNGTLETTVSIDLPRGKGYDIIFFAKNPNAPYTFNAGDQTFSIDYDAMQDCSETYDAFVRTLHNFAVSGPGLTDVVLYRPFAQINIGTTDLEIAKAGMMNVDEVTVAVSDTYNEFNFMGGINGMGEVVETSHNENPVTFTATIPEDEIFPCAEAPANTTLMAMHYVLVPTEKQICNVAFRVSDTDYKTLNIDNVNVQRNHRTNIWGTLLTSPVDLHIVIDPIFDDPEYDIAVYTGSASATLPEPNEDGVIVINHPSQLARLALNVAGGNGYFGQDFQLAADMDLNNFEWLPIGNYDTPFNGNLDGNGFHIKNLKISQPAAKVYSGFFGVTYRGSIKNLVFENANITSKIQGNNCGLGVVAGLAGNTNYENITVTGNIFVTGEKNVGAVFGTGAYGSLTNIIVDASDDSFVNSISVEEGYMTRPAYVGGIMGYSGKPAIGTTVTFENLQSNINVSSSCLGVGGLIGVVQEGIILSNSKCTGNVNLTAASQEKYAQSVGGLFGMYTGACTIENSFFSGNLTCTLNGNPFSNFLNGGLFGMYYNGLSLISNRAELVTVNN